MDPVIALGIGAQARMRHTFAWFSFGKRRNIPGLVIHAVKIPILKHAVVATARAFPEFIVLKHDLLRHGMMKSELRPTLQPLDQRVVHKQLSS